MKSNRHIWLLLIIVFAITLLACNLVSNIARKAEQIESAAQTAQALATSGQEIYSTVQGSGIMQTAAAMATKAEEEGLMSTVQAAVTQIPEQGANIKATAEVILTQGGYGQAPPNIPLVYGEVNDFFGSPSLVTYTTPMGLQEVVDFYRQTMPGYGWNTGNDTTVLTSSYAILSFRNANEKATITLSKNPFNGDTIVLINVSTN